MAPTVTIIVDIAETDDDNTHDLKVLPLGEDSSYWSE